MSIRAPLVRCHAGRGARREPRIATGLAVGALVLLACEPRPAIPTTDASVAAAAPESTPQPVLAPPPAAASTPAPAIVPDAFQLGPLDYAASSTGILLAWSRQRDDDASEIVVQSLDRRGVPQGGPRLVHRSDGEIVDLALSTASGGAWIAYVAELEFEPPTGIVGAVALADDLSAISAPLVLDRFSHHALVAWDSERVRVQALGRDSAIVAALGAPVACRDRVRGGERPCPGYHLYEIDGTAFLEVAQVGVDGGQSDMGALIDVGAGHLLDVWAWHGGPSHAGIYLPRAASKAAAPKFRRIDCRPPIRRGFDGAALVTFCADDLSDLDVRCHLVGDPGDDDACDRFHAVDLADRVLTPRQQPQGPAITSQQLRCHDGHPVLDIAWKGGQRRLDPQAPRAALDLRSEMGVWTGELGVRIAADGRIDRFRCEEDRLVESTEPGAPASVDLAAAALGPVPAREPT
ncbi:hypothetical protein [Nannocystis radixulma]|uniref:Uncharacterized protein n=1 Tax=Nannocystis radixulma TaxID=2995305 RepID=A0ABT5B7Q1_9BACT|nr:hypothetical protein [Nannocystis radixulma]MDC0670145.1 hypothetical protein [Nannocystis radixulma]